MKQVWLGLICWLAFSAHGWADTVTGMPAFDALQADVIKNGGLSKRLGFSDEQRKNIQNLIATESKDLVKLRDARLAAEAKLEAAKKSKNKANTVAARAELDAAAAALDVARDNSFDKLKTLMTGPQFKGLKKWRAEGNANAR